MAPLKLDTSCTAHAKKPSSIYFGGCAFGAAFYVGVVEAMVDMWGKDFHKDVLFSGDSVGSIFAVGLALGKSPQYLDNLYRDVGDLYGKSNSQREFYTAPSTTIPNNQTSFAKWCYSVGPTCKERSIYCTPEMNQVPYIDTQNPYTQNDTKY
jgi:patatin-like phospholipase/acyl hydrolase